VSWQAARYLFRLGGALWLLCGGRMGWAVTLVPPLTADHQADWVFVGGGWRLGQGTLEQQEPTRHHVALLRTPAFSDFVMTAEFNIRAVGSGVRAAALVYRATGTRTYYWVHFDAKHSQVILVQCTPGDPWIEIMRRPLTIACEAWHTARVECRGPQMTVVFDGAPVLSCCHQALAAGTVGVGTSEGRVVFRSLRVEGEVLPMSEPLREEHPPYKIISRGEAAGPYQAFPDVCRLQNGDLLCVFYAGYGHVSLPNAAWPRGGRICAVRSRDEGRTWSVPRILYDDPYDNRDPHIAQLRDGTVVCSFFSLRQAGEKLVQIGAQLVRSHDGGETWEPQAQLVAPGWGVSAPVRQMPDGTCLLGLYYQTDGQAWGGVIRSTDGGATWSQPIPIGQESGAYLDAETDVILLKDGTLFAALRSSKVNMHFATSPDLGLSWSPARDIGFAGHAPHLTRLRSGEILLTHRLPYTALHVSRDEGKTWQGPYVLDQVIGAYPSTVELSDGTILAVYYEEGEGSAVRALRFRLKADGIEYLPLD
jgi:hypothetical protein